jgi:ABC-type transport system involved in cytochrome c biogenesis permease subunit
MTAATEKSLLVAGISILVIASVADVLLRVRQRSSVATTNGLIGLAVMMLAVAIAGRWIREQQGPFLTLYDVLLSNLFSLGLICLVTYSVAPRLRVTTVVVLPILVLLGLWLLTVPPEAIPLPATFDNSWLWLHVTAGKIFLGLCLVAAAASMLLIIEHYGLPGGRLLRGVESNLLDDSIWRVFALAFIGHSFMLIAGAIWAHSAWGRYWAWDPLETSTLITWLAMALLLHTRITYRNMPAHMSWAAVIAIFLLAFLVFFGVPFSSIAPHKGII